MLRILSRYRANGQPRVSNQERRQPGRSGKSASFDDAKVQHLSSLSPEERAEIAFIMDAQEMFHAVKDMRKNGLTLQVVYHSHPHDPARPSVTDIKIADEWEENWSRLNLTLPIYLLISLMDKSRPDVRAYWIRSGTVSRADIART